MAGTARAPAMECRDRQSTDFCRGGSRMYVDDSNRVALHVSRSTSTWLFTTTWLALISLTLAACGHMPQKTTGQAAPSCWRAYAEQIPGVSNSIYLCATDTHGAPRFHLHRSRWASSGTRLPASSPRSSG
jgi:hypothetical protein